MLKDGSISSDMHDVLDHWKNEFSLLLNNDDNSKNSWDENVNTFVDAFLDCNTKIQEVKKAADSAKRGKAPGIDTIHSEVLKMIHL